jgi:endoglucanase
MKNLLFSALAFVMLWSCQSKPESNGSPADFKIFKGTNLAHWLSQSDQRGAARDTFFQEKDIVAIKELGFDYIRFPLDEDQMWDENGVRHEDAFKLLTSCLDWCRKHQLKVIVDMHTLRSHNFWDKGNPLMIDLKEQEKFYRLWGDLSSVLKKYSLSDVAYELLNAPFADDPEQWNNVVANAVKAIRALEPERMLVIGSNLCQSTSTFDVLKVPDDKNIMLSFQFYEPFLLTFYKASWFINKDYTGPVHYPGALLTKAEYDSLSSDQQTIVKDFVGVEWNREKMEEMMQIPLKKAKELGIQVCCAEFGTNVNIPEADKIRWYNDMISVFNKNGIASSNWNYKSDDMGLFNGNGVKNEVLIQVVLKK